MNSVKVVGIVAIIVFCFIYFVVNEDLRKDILTILNFRIKKVKVKNIFAIFILIILILYSIQALLKSKEFVDFYIKLTQNQEDEYAKSKEIINAQNRKYKELFGMKTDLENCKNPYIPNKFNYVEGEWNTGFVIEDELGNQFVWVPCTNIENEEGIPLLKKEKFTKNNVIYFNCYEQDNFEEFMISSLENGGFYISRYEIGKENNIPVSKNNCEIWTNVNWNEANELAESMYSTVHSELINGYAIDTAISFIFDEIDMKNIDKTVEITGNKSYKNIYDLVDDMNEWTSEIRNGSKIYRGSVFEEVNKIQELIIFADRFSSDLEMDNLGFRTVIYK